MTNVLAQATINGGYATLNGKSYRLLRAYATAGPAPDCPGADYVFLALAGKTRLLPSDLGEHWRVVRAGAVYFAYYARVFSYHLLGGAEARPLSDGWPKVKTTECLVFVGPTEEGALETARLALRQHRPDLDMQKVETILGKGAWLPDQAGGPVRALRLKASLS